MSEQGHTQPLGASLDATLLEGKHAAGPTGAPVVAGYDLVRELGRGGMGVVFEAVEHRLDRRVALKVHLPPASGDEIDFAALWNEARLAAKVSDAGVVPVHDVGRTLDGYPYYTMELVTGTDLGAVIKDGPMPAPRAMRVALEIARAVAAAHDAGIVHRDLKPRNVMIDREGRARVLDFGLAMRIAPQGSAGGVVAGSPPYMAPEQIEGTSIGPPTDVHAIGIILYEMLTATRPFRGHDHASTLFQVLQTVPPPPSSLVSVHPEVDRICMRCLAKKPADRYASARPLADALLAVIEGRPLPTDEGAVAREPYRPRVTPTRNEKPQAKDAGRTFEWRWDLRSAPSALWPYVSDTDRFNELVGLGTVHVDPARQSPDTTAREAHAQALGFTLRWREYPFQWVKDREHSVFRWYSEGPLEAIWNQVELTPRADGGTHLVHRIAATPRGVSGRVAVLVEIGQRLRRAINRVYEELDLALASGQKEAWAPPHRPTPGQQARVSSCVDALVKRGFPAQSVGRLASFVLTAPSRELMRMQPGALARRWEVPRDLLLDMMLHAAQVGLLDLAWDLVCPNCMIAHESVGGLDGVRHTGHCHACEIDYERDLSSSVELVFRPHPEVRVTKPETFCAGSPARKPHVLAQVVLDPGEVRTVTVPLAAGDYFVSGIGKMRSGELSASGVGHSASAEVVVSAGSIEVLPRIALEGDVTLRIVNDTDVEQLLRVEAKAARHDSMPAARALTHPTFREFFSRELFAHGELLGVSHLAFMAVDASDRGELFANRGDAEACATVRSVEESFSRVVRDEQGTPLPGALDTFLAAFHSPARALRAALALLADTKGKRIRIALHDGRCLALTRDARIDYFGETLHRTLWLVESAKPREVLVTQTTADDPDVARVLVQRGIVTRVEAARSGPYQGRRVVAIGIDENAP